MVSKIRKSQLESLMQNGTQPYTAYICGHVTSKATSPAISLPYSEYPVTKEGSVLTIKPQQLEFENVEEFVEYTVKLAMRWYSPTLVEIEKFKHKWLNTPVKVSLQSVNEYQGGNLVHLMDRVTTHSRYFLIKDGKVYDSIGEEYTEADITCLEDLRYWQALQLLM